MAAVAHKDYSATPLPKKLGIREGSIISVKGAPRGFELELPPDASITDRRTGSLDVAILFVTLRSELSRSLSGLSKRVFPNGRLWICWPKKASSLETDLDFDIVHRTGLATGLVDNKSASITDDFQGLQFVYRLKDRPR